MMKNDPVVKTIKHAKSLSLKKWHKARKDLEALIKHCSQPCGFCELSRSINPISMPGLETAFGCVGCPVPEKCVEMDMQVIAFLNGSLIYIEDTLIPYIENFQLNGKNK